MISTYPLCGSTTIALGFTSSSLISVFMYVPLIVVTAIMSSSESVMYIFLDSQSIAIPSGDLKPVIQKNKTIYM